MKKLTLISWLFCFTLAASAEPRTWTNRDGQTMEASLVSVAEDSVVFSRSGTTYNYPFSDAIYH